jgi:hypothetical protein
VKLSKSAEKRKRKSLNGLEHAKRTKMSGDEPELRKEKKSKQEKAEKEANGHAEQSRCLSYQKFK